LASIFNYCHNSVDSIFNFQIRTGTYVPFQSCQKKESSKRNKNNIYLCQQYTKGQQTPDELMCKNKKNIIMKNY
jgi:hypothetical protein